MGEGDSEFILRLTTGSPAQDKIQIAATDKNNGSIAVYIPDGHNIATVSAPDWPGLRLARDDS